MLLPVSVRVMVTYLPQWAPFSYVAVGRATSGRLSGFTLPQLLSRSRNK